MNIQDRKKSLTAEDLRRRYNLDDLDKDRKSIQLVKNTLNKVEIEFQNFMDAIKKVLNDYPSQVEITTWFLDGIPTDEHPEFDVPSEHLGDLYYDRQSGKAYEYIYEDDEYIWEETTDRDIVKTLTIESSKPDTADNKRLVFNSTPTTPYSIGDVWINGSTYYRCRCARESGTYNIADWIIYTDYTDDMVLTDTRAVLDQFKTTVTQDYVSQVQLETNTQGIYANVSETYSTKTEVSTVDGKATQAKETADTTQSKLIIQAGRIDLVNSQIGDRTGKTQTLTAEINEIKASISDIADLTKSETTTTAYIPDTSFQNINASVPINIEIRPLGNNISYDYPYNDYPQVDYSKIRLLRFHNTTTNEIFDYMLPDDLLYYDIDNYDTFIADYENRVCKVIKKCKYNVDGSVGTLATSVENTYDFSDIESTLNLTDGNYEVLLPSYTSGYMFVRLMSQNIYTTQFATKVELSAEISLTKEDYTVKLGRKVGDNEVISKINLTSEAATIDASKVNITGVITAINNNTATTIDGNKITTGTITANQLSSNSVNADKIVANSITAGKIADATITGSKIANGTITGTKISNSTIANANIQDGTIENAKIKNATITGAKISAGTITADKISSGAITTDKLSANCITTAKIASGAITATQIASGTITGDKIAAGTITASKVASDVITTNNFSAQNINASQITSGTINANRIAANSISATKLYIPQISAISTDLGSITAGSIDINGYFSVNRYGGTQLSTSGGGFLTTRTTIHPYVSALNLALGYDYGLNFGTGDNQNNYGSTQSRIYQAYETNGYTLNVIGKGELYLGRSSGAHISMVNKMELAATNGASIWAIGNNLESGRVKTSVGDASSRILKTNIQKFNKQDYQDAYNFLNKMDLSSYDYKYNMYANKHQYGFIIDELEEIDNCNKFFRFTENIAQITKDGRLNTSIMDDLEVDKDNLPEDYIKYKEYDSDVLDKFILTCLKALQFEIEKLKVGEING